MGATRSRRRDTRLARPDIISASIEALDAGTLDDLSIRGLAERLGVTPMALYAHVADKDEILDEILDVALRRDATAEAPPTHARDWRPWLVRFVGQLRGVLLAQPALLDRYLRAPVGVPAALDRMEAALGVLSAAGFEDGDAVEIFASVHTFTLGFTTLEVARQRAAAEPARRATALLFDPRSPGYWPAYFGSLPGDRYPLLSRSRPDLVTFTSSAQFERAVSDLLRGWPAAGRSTEPKGRQR